MSRKKPKKSKKSNLKASRNQSSATSRSKGGKAPRGSSAAVIVYGLNSVMEVAKSNPDEIIEIHIQRKDSKTLMGEINYYFENRPNVVFYDATQKNDFKSELERNGIRADEENHQGIFCLRKPFKIFQEKEFMKELEDGELSENKNFKILALDGIQDPHHFGAIIRISAAFNVPWIVIQSTRSAPLSEVSLKVSSGGVEHVKICEVTNLSRFLEEIKKKDFWNIGMSERGESRWKKVREPGRYAIVIGNEGDGIRPIIREQCDFWLKLPVTEDFPSLSASTATSATLALFNA